MGISRSEKARLSGTQAVEQRRDYLQLATGTQLTPAKITSAIRSADTGDIRTLVEMALDILGGRDLHLSGILQTRRAAVAGKPHELRPGVRLGKETRPEVMDACRLMLAGLDGFPRLIGQMQDAVVMPLSAHELTLEISEGQAWYTRATWVHPKRFRWNTGLDSDPTCRLGELRLVTDADLLRGERLKDDKWLIHQVTAQTDYPWRQGLARSLVWYQGFKAFGMLQWMIWLEVCAMPLRHGTVPVGAGQEARDLLKQALIDMGSDACAVFEEGSGIEFVPNGNNAGDQAYQRLIMAINEEESKAVLGHSGSADSTPGKLGGESLAGEIRQDLVEADARGIEGDIESCILSPFVRLNWGPDEPVPTMHLMVDAQTSKRETMSLAKEAWAMGLPVDREWLAASTGVQLTSDPKKQLPPPGAQGMAQTVAGVNAPQPNAVPIGGGQ